MDKVKAGYKSLCSFAFRLSLSFVLALAMCVPSLAGICFNTVPAYASDGDAIEVPDTKDYLSDNLAQNESVLPFFDFWQKGKNGIKQTGMRMEVQYLLADCDKIPDTEANRTIAWMYANAKDAIVANVESTVELFEKADKTGDYLALVDPMQFNGAGKILSFDATNGDDLNPIWLDSKLSYDYTTGILYIPRAVMEDESLVTETSTGLRVQFLTAYDWSKATSSVQVSIDNNNPDISAPWKAKTIDFNAMDNTLVIPVATKESAQALSTQDITIDVNDMTVVDHGDCTALGKGSFAYSALDGEIVLSATGLSTSKVDIKIDGGSGFANKAHALNFDPKTPAATIAKKMKVLPKSIVDGFSLEGLEAGDLVSYKGKTYKWDNKNTKWKSLIEKVHEKTGPYRLSLVTKDSDGNWTAAGSKYMNMGNPSKNVTLATLASNDNLWFSSTKGLQNFALPVPTGKATKLRGGSDAGTVNFGEKGEIWKEAVSYNGNKYALLAGTCTMIHDNVSADDELSFVGIAMRVLYVAADNSYAIVGFVSDGTTDGQAGGGIYKIATASVQIKVKKSFSDAAASRNSHYSLKGAQYQLYEDASCTQAVEDGLMTTNASGESNAIEDLQADVYYAKELKASPGCLLDTTVHKIDATDGEDKTFSSSEEPKKISVSVEKKTVEEDDFSKDLKTYSKAGAVYKLFSNRADAESAAADPSANVNSPAATLTTKESGVSNVGQVLGGVTYYAAETAAPPGYARSTKVIAVNVQAPDSTLTDTKSSWEAKESSKTSFEAYDPPQYSSPNAFVQKLNKETGNPAAANGSDLAGAQFRIDYWDNMEWSGQASRSWMYETDADYQLKLQEDPLLGNPYKYGEKNVFPIGTYTVTETKAPTGYHLNTHSVSFKIAWSGKKISENDKEIEFSYEGNGVIQVAEQVQRGELALLKKDEDENPLAGIPFLITYKGPEKSAVDDFEAENEQDEDEADGAEDEAGADAGDDAVSEADADGDADANDGVDDGTSAGLDTDPDEEDADTDVDEDADTDVDEGASSTDADADSDTDTDTTGDAGAHEGSSDSSNTEPDTVKAGIESHIIVTDENGRWRSQPGHGWYTRDAESVNGNDKAARWNDGTYVEGSVDTSKLDPKLGIWFSADAWGKTAPASDRGAFPYGNYTIRELPCEANKGFQMIVRDITIKKSDDADGSNPEVIEIVMTNHASIGIATTAADKADADQWVAVSENSTVIDTVNCWNLKPGTQYRLVGTILDKATGKPIVDASGSEVSSEHVFRAMGSSTTQEIEFAFDTTKLAGHELVVFEKLFLASNDKEPVAAHEDTDDEAQAIFVEYELSTSASDTADGDHYALSGTRAKLADSVSYKGLKPNETYQIVGTLVSKTTQMPIMDANGKTMSVQKSFTPESSSGNVNLEFEVDTSICAGDTIVVYETLMNDDGTKVARHEDPNAEEQSIHVPGGSTSATDAADGDKLLPSTGEVTVIDTVTYSGLMAGKEHTLTGTLMNKATKQPVVQDGTELTVTKTFTPAEPDGSIDMAFSLKTDALAGSSLVAFENMSYDGQDVFVHADLESADQTVYIPRIGTTLTDSADGDHAVTCGKETILVDKVVYSGLQPDKTYRVKGVLMDKESGKALIVNGQKVTAASSKFKPKAANGSIKVRFKLDSLALKGKAAVAFERLYSSKGEIIAKHENLDDKAQTVAFSKSSAQKASVATDANSKTSPYDKTGTTLLPLLTLITLLVAASVASGAYALRVKKGRRKPLMPDERL